MTLDSPVRSALAGRDQPPAVALRRRSLIAGFVIAVLVLGAGGIYVLTRPQQWSAKTTVLVLPGKNLGTSNEASFFDTLSTGELPSTVGEMLGLNRFKQAAAAKLGLPPSQAHQVTVASATITGTTLVTVTATAPNEHLATSMADGVVTAAGPAITSLISPYQIAVVSESTPTATESRSFSLGKFLVVLVVVAVALGVGAQQVVTQADVLVSLRRRRQQERRRAQWRPDADYCGDNHHEVDLHEENHHHGANQQEDNYHGGDSPAEERGVAGTRFGAAEVDDDDTAPLFVDPAAPVPGNGSNRADQTQARRGSPDVNGSPGSSESNADRRG